MTNVKKGKVKHISIMEGDAKQDRLYQRSLKHFKMYRGKDVAETDTYL